MNPTVKLLSHTANPIQTIYCLWLESKDNVPVPTPEEVDPNDPKVLDVFRKVIDSHIPVSDFVQFVFLLTDISVSFREQMVRHRVGQRFGPRLGVDVVPDLGGSSFWGQSMRILDMGTFAQEGRFLIPESLKGKRVKFEPLYPGSKEEEMDAEEYYCMQMDKIESAYRRLANAGIPLEDARNLIPLGATHRFSWTLNLTSLRHVIGKRSCWIPQIDLWRPIIEGMVDELSTKVHPYFRNLVNPPCIGGDGKFSSCVYKIDNERRVSREDSTLPCPLYLNHSEHKEKDTPSIIGMENVEWFETMLKKFSDLWKRNPWTGEPHVSNKPAA